MDLTGIGWVIFAGAVLVLAGFLALIEGLVAFLRPTVYAAGGNEMVIAITYTAWGWVHVVLGIAAIISGCGLLALRNWARRMGVVLACLSAVANMVFIVSSPVWPVLMIALDLLVIYALLVHGRRFATGPSM